MLMKLPTSVPTKRRKIVNGVKPTFAKAMLTAPKKTRATTANNKTNRNAKNRKLW
jgi:hypothetical protein